MKKLSKVVFWLLLVSALIYLVATVRKYYSYCVDVIGAVTGALGRTR